MRLIIFVAVIALASANEEDVKDKRQVALGGLGYGGLGYGGLGYGLGYGLPYGGFGYGLGGYPAVIGRKRRDVAEETDESTKEKRQLLLGGYGLGGYGLGYGGLGYGLPYGGFGYGLGGYPAVIGRKRRDVAEEESTKEKRQLLLGGYGLGGYGLGYGLPVGGYGLGLGYGLGGFPAVYGRKRRDVDEVADKAAHEKRQLIGAYPAVGGVLPVGGVVGAYPGVVGAYPGVVGGYPLGGVVGGYPGVGIGAPGVLL